jgi:hypothetical protein
VVRVFHSVVTSVLRALIGRRLEQNVAIAIRYVTLAVVGHVSIDGFASALMCMRKLEVRVYGIWDEASSEACSTRDWDCRRYSGYASSIIMDESNMVLMCYHVAIGSTVSASFLFIIGLANSVILWRIIKHRRMVRRYHLMCLEESLKKI